MTSSHHEQQPATTSVIDSKATQVITYYDSEKTVALFYVTQLDFDWQYKQECALIAV